MKRVGGGVAINRERGKHPKNPKIPRSKRTIQNTTRTRVGHGLLSVPSLDETRWRCGIINGDGHGK